MSIKPLVLDLASPAAPRRAAAWLREQDAPFGGLGVGWREREFAKVFSSHLPEPPGVYWLWAVGESPSPLPPPTALSLLRVVLLSGRDFSAALLSWGREDSRRWRALGEELVAERSFYFGSWGGPLGKEGVEFFLALDREVRERWGIESSPFPVALVSPVGNALLAESFRGEVGLVLEGQVCPLRLRRRNETERRGWRAVLQGGKPDPHERTFNPALTALHLRENYELSLGEDFTLPLEELPLERLLAVLEGKEPMPSRGDLRAHGAFLAWVDWGG